MEVFNSNNGSIVNKRFWGQLQEDLTNASSQLKIGFGEGANRLESDINQSPEFKNSPRHCHPRGLKFAIHRRELSWS